MDHEYDKTYFDHCVLMKKFSSEKYIILFLYVNDMLIVVMIKMTFKVLKKNEKSFAIKDLGLVKQILDMKIVRDRKK